MKHEPGSPSLSSNAERIASHYDKLWEDSKDELARGLVEPDPVPLTGSNRWGVSAIVRPHKYTANGLEKVALQLTTFTDQQQIVYDTTTLHTTLRSIEAYRSDIDHHDEKVHAYIEILQTLARQFEPLQIFYQGLTANKTGILAQGWPIGEKFQALRQAFHQKLDDAHLLSGPERQHTRQTAHASLMVFSGPLINPKLLVEFIQNHRQTIYGTSTINSLEIVRYKRTPSTVEIITLKKIFLGE